ncbi:MAG: DUF6379 domain-containing protein [Anaerolineales bacterium]|jgi:hypothetical protein|nr:DUF6379 domain-containing protein [Anaerolineales bacterium]
MYDSYMIVGEELKNVVQQGEITGFQIGMRLCYYRGIVLSLIGDIRLSVDGEEMPQEAMTITVGGKTFPFADLENQPVAKWEFGEVGILTIHKPGGLKPGEHTLNLREHLKISYVPMGFSGVDTKVLHLAA